MDINKAFDEVNKVFPTVRSTQETYAMSKVYPDLITAFRIIADEFDYSRNKKHDNFQKDKTMTEITQEDIEEMISPQFRIGKSIWYLMFQTQRLPTQHNICDVSGLNRLEFSKAIDSLLDGGMVKSRWEYTQSNFWTTVYLLEPESVKIFADLWHMSNLAKVGHNKRE